jgi:metal-responsive CopG/Arc/MetJ family transcriptional regulator
MKTAISIPDDVFEEAEQLARREGRSRSDVYSAAVREYVARYGGDELTDSIDRAIAELGEAAAPDPFVRSAGRDRLSKATW